MIEIIMNHIKEIIIAFLMAAAALTIGITIVVRKKRNSYKVVQKNINTKGGDVAGRDIKR